MHITTFGDTSDQQIILYELYHMFWEQQKKNYLVINTYSFKVQT